MSSTTAGRWRGPHLTNLGASSVESGARTTDSEIAAARDEEIGEREIGLDRDRRCLARTIEILHAGRHAARRGWRRRGGHARRGRGDRLRRGDADRRGLRVGGHDRWRLRGRQILVLLAEELLLADHAGGDHRHRRGDAAAGRGAAAEQCQ